MQRLKRKCLQLLILLPVTLFAETTEEFLPLYAGTLLSFYPTNVAPGHISIQPFVFITNVYGSYERNWSVLHKKNINNNNLLLALETGITNFLDVTLIINESYNRIRSRHTWRYGDTTLYFGFQMMRDKRHTWIPDMRLLLGEIFPTGKYKNLNPNRIEIDSFGAGSYQTSIVLVTRKIFYTFPYPFSLNLNLFYIIPISTHVNGYNAYGGGPGTNGTVHIGNMLIANLGLELSLTRNWELGLDMRYEQRNNSAFSGKTILPSGMPSSQRFSLAPCLVYNFNEDFSAAVGAWFSVAGRNNNAFVSCVANIFYLF